MVMQSIFEHLHFIYFLKGTVTLDMRYRTNNFNFIIIVGFGMRIRVRTRNNTHFTAPALIARFQSPSQDSLSLRHRSTMSKSNPFGSTSNIKYVLFSIPVHCQQHRQQPHQGHKSLLLLANHSMHCICCMDILQLSLYHESRQYF